MLWPILRAPEPERSRLFRPYSFFRLSRLTPWPEGAVDPLRAMVVNMWIARGRPEALDLALDLGRRGRGEKGSQDGSNPQ